MSIQQSQVEQALEILGEGTRLDVLGEHADLLRYAESQITAQHSERRLRVRVRTTRAGRTVAGSLETLDPGAVRTLATRLDAALADLPAQSTAASRAARATPRDERSGAGSQHEAESAAADAAASASPAEFGGEAPQVVPAASVLDGDPALRHRWFAAVRDGLDSATTLGGAIRFDVLDRVVADSDGLFRAETLTKAAIQAIAKKGDNSVSVRYMHRDADQVPVGEIAGKLRAALTPLPTKEAHHGPCRVLLKPQAVITLIATYGHFVLGATGYATGRSAVAGRLGERVVSDLINLVDDGADAAGLPSGFDAEGNVRRRTQLIENGVLTGVVSDRRRAAVTGGVPTGHAVPDGWRFGGDPSPSNLLLAPGGATDEQLLEECGSGLVVNRLDYLRSLHPKQTLVTGTTRDGTYWADGGEVVAWHPQVRFTFRMDDVLNAVLAVGNTRECGDTTFMDSVVVPSLLIDAGPLVLP